MPITTYPGIYIEELPSGVHTITGVSTSVAAFLGYFSRGPMNKAVHVFSQADVERSFGAPTAQSEAAYAIQQFFLNGGTEAWVIRVASGTPQAASIVLMDEVGGTDVLIATAASDGEWGNNLRIEVDDATTDPGTTFNLTVTEVSTTGGTTQVVSTEKFLNLSMDPTQPNFAVDVVNGGSALITLALAGSPPLDRPAQTGTVSAAITNPGAVSNSDTMDVTVNGSLTASGLTLGGDPHGTVAELAATLQAKIRSADPSLGDVTVAVMGSASTSQFLLVKTNSGATDDIIELGDTLGTDLGFAQPIANVQQYVLGASSAIGAQDIPGGGAQSGEDGDLPDGDALKGDQASKTGLFALEDVDLFNILCIPDTMLLTDTAAADVSAQAEAYCSQRRAFYILDVPEPAANPREQVAEISTYLDANGTLRSKNAALYYPRPRVADPLNGFRLRSIAPSGTIAGLFARIDATRGVWKAPAGTEAGLRGVQALEYRLTDAENGVLNPVAINCLRTFPIFGTVCWGARTLDGADQQASEWKYIPVRRVALYIEESLYRGTKWVVFEPNDEPLWAQIRLNVGAFMHDLFRQGAFQGKTPQEAYFVKCDKETTTQNDIDRGVVNIVVGFAPLKPAEFVVIQIQQIAGQIAT